MPPKSSEKDSKNKKEKSEAIRRILTKDMNIIETTYDKVLSIINNVKDFLKKNAKHSQKLIEDLEWVIKVISNKSLYSYELKQSKLHRQNSEFNKFINFVQKYNEEILEMNKRHILVTGLLNLVKKKGEMLNKPSLCLKRILPEELQNMDYKKEKEKKSRKKNFITLLGNAILNLYYKNKDKYSVEGSTDHLEEKEEKLKTETNESKSKSKEKINNNKETDHSKDSNNFDNIIIQNYTANNFKKINQLKKEGNKKRMSSSNKNKKNRKKKIIDERNKRNVDSRSNFEKWISNHQTNNSVGIRKNNIIKLTKKEQPTLNSIKNAMENYYSKYTLFEQNGNHNSTKSNANKNKNFYRTNVNLNIQKNNNSTYFERGAMAYKNLQNDSFSFRNKKNKNERHQTLILKNNKDSLLFKKKILKGNKFFEPIEQYTKSNKSYIEKKSKRLFSKRKRFNINKTQNQKLIKNKVKDKDKDKDKEKDEKENNNKSEQQQPENNKQEKIPLNVLIDKYFDDMKMITDKDFDIFEFKEKVGYINVLPLMCHCILKTLGLLDNRIITVTKVESFLNSVNENYKETTLYHNSLHGADVTQSLCVYFLNSNAEEICESNVLDLLGIIVSAMGHDLGHPGLTNNFHINASTDLAITYNDASCLENFHTSFLFKIIRKEENNIFDKLTVENYKSIRKRMISQILATDMANHGEVMSLIRAKVKSFQEHEGEAEGEDKFNLLSGNEKTKFDEQQVLLNYLMHSADLGHNCKKYEISKKWVHLLCEEFWMQGDQEKKLGIPVSFLCDRDKIDVPASQVNFLRGFIISSFDCLISIFPNLKYTMENAKNNIKEWQKLLDEHRVTGWTPQNETNNEEEKKE
jgi:hypothetical protein